MSHRLARLTRGQYLGLLALVAAIGLVPQFLSRTLPDISFLLYAAGRVLDGATLYVDLIEINPPLIVWLNLPIVALARAAGVSELALYRIFVTLLLVVSAAACAAIIRKSDQSGASARRRTAASELHAGSREAPFSLTVGPSSVPPLPRSCSVIGVLPDAP